MYFLRSCKIIYEDLSVKNVTNCDGIGSIFSMPNISATDILILLTCVFITFYFILKTYVLLKGDK